MIPSDTSLKIYRPVVGIRRIVGYDIKPDDAEVLYGNRLGIYHPVCAKLYIFDKIDWQIYDFISDNGSCLKQIVAAFQSVDYKLLVERIEAMLDNSLIIRSDEIINIRINTVADSAELYIKTTEGCNFACTGCATSSDIILPSQARTLPVETAMFFLERFIRSCSEKRFTHAHIKWGGGEPMLNNSYGVIVGSADYISKLQQKYPEVLITQSILTNGVFLTDEKIRFAADSNIHISVSLWGTAYWQDRMRNPRNKQKTFPLIIENLRKAHESGVEYNVNYVLTPVNYRDYPEFLTQMWDMEHAAFVGKGWRKKKPLPLGINFFRPQNPIQIKAMKSGYNCMAKGVRMGHARIFDMLQRSIPIQPLHRIDYLDLFNIVTTACGSGINYIAVGPEGAASCHEGLFQMPSNLDRIKNGENMFDVVNEPYSKIKSQLYGPNIIFDEGKILSLHGGQGCIRLSNIENKGKAGIAASTSRLYNEIYQEMLSLEVMRRTIH